MPRILVVGSINMDQMMVMERCPLPGESFIGSSLSYSPGGKGGNSAIAAARLSAEVAFAGCVGDDGFGQQLRQSLVDEGVDTSLLRTTSAAPSGLAPIIVEADGQNRIIVYPGANMCIDVNDVPAMFAMEPDAVMMQLEIPKEVIMEVSRQAKRRNIPVVLDAGPAQRFSVGEMEGLFILSPNETECTALTGMPVGTIEETRQAAKQLLSTTNASFVVVKMGARGAYLLGEEYDEFIPAFRVDAVDPTAAGDTFTGAMTIEYLLTKDMKKAVVCGCAAGAIAATKVGAQPSLPTMEQVRALLATRPG